MKYVLLIFVLSTIVIFNAKSQDFDQNEYYKLLDGDTISFYKFSYRNVPGITSKSKIIETLGQPDSVVNPHYECGGFSEDWQEKTYLQLFYNSVDFIGPDEDYFLERADFESDNSLNLYYKDVKLNSKTNIKLFKELFPKSYKNRKVIKEKNQIEQLYLYFTYVSDDKIIAIFKKGFLIKIFYYTPC